MKRFFIFMIVRKASAKKYPAGLAKGKIIVFTEAGELPKPEVVQAWPKRTRVRTNNIKESAEQIYLKQQTVNC